VFIIILNWNGREDTLVCLDSVRKINYPDFEVVVVDNGSIDDSVKVIRKTFPEVAVLETGENLGFAGGNNVGIRYALEQDAEYLFLLNNDTVVDPQVLGGFMEASSSVGQEAIFGAKIYYFAEPNKIWYAGAKWNGKNSHFTHVGQDCTDDGKKFNVLSATDYACGCAFFVSARLLQRIGLLDEKYYLTFEETDLCYRAKKMGYESYFVPEAKVWHKVSTSFGGGDSPLYSYFLMRNKLLWAKKNLPFSQRMMLYRNVYHDLLYYVLPPSFRMDKFRDELPLKALHFSLKEYVGEYVKRCREKNKNPIKKAKLFALRDYFGGRFGNCSDEVRTLGK
jgi:hypothetical protein